MGLLPSRGCGFSSAYWPLAACSLTSRIYLSKYWNSKTGMWESCLVSTGHACLSTVAPVFPCRAELHSFIQCVSTWGRTCTSQMLTPVRRQVCRQQYGLCYSFAFSSYGKAFLKASTILATDIDHIVYKSVEPCDTKSILTLIIKLRSFTAQYVTWFVPIYQSFSLPFRL